MRCPKCDANQIGADANGLRARGRGVLQSRLAASGGIRRRRACIACGHRFTTLEVIVREGGYSTTKLLPPGMQSAETRGRMLELADKASEIAGAIRAELNEQTVLSL